MKIYARLLAYAKPIEKFAIPYFFFSILGTFFGLMNFTLLIPLLNILFGQEGKVADIPTTMPEFKLTASYLIDLFNYQFHHITLIHGKMGALYFITSIIIGSVFLSNLFNYLSVRIMEDLRIHTLLNLRRAVFNKVISLDIGYFSNQRKGDIIQVITGDVQVVQMSLSSILLVFFKDPIHLIGYFILLFTMSFKLTIFTLFMIPISGFIISRIVKKLKHRATQLQVSLGNMLTLLDEALTGLRIVKAFNAIPFIQEKFHSENKSYAHLTRSFTRRQELAQPVSEFLGVFVVSGIVLYGGSLVLGNSLELQASTFVSYIIMFSQVLRPAKSITNSFGQIQTGKASGERVLNLIDTEVHIQEIPDAKIVKDLEDGIEFRNVSFGYGEKEVLKNINFKIPVGKTVALVGPSGGGKSTISDLIPRFYDVKKGGIYLDGVNIRNLNIESLRSLMGIVSQEAILFNDTIFNNIAFGKPHATLEEVIQAAKVANAHDFISSSEEGYQSIVGDRGVKLSGGQKQRISIARAVLKNPPLLLLDEATSALDTESEKLVQEALNNLMKNRTTLVIAHRLSTIQNADKIIVIQEGQIVEEGTHEDLSYLEGGLYKRLTTMQSL